ncbi:MAG: hypothetical protein HDS49_05565 [Bacteroides sp.]|nr:hypothetical protein [Bacteroides sp.]
MRITKLIVYMTLMSILALVTIGCSKETIAPAIATNTEASIRSIDDEFVLSNLRTDIKDIPVDRRKEMTKLVNAQFILAEYILTENDQHRLVISQGEAAKLGVPEDAYNLLSQYLEDYNTEIASAKIKYPDFKVTDLKVQTLRLRAQIFPSGFKVK